MFRDFQPEVSRCTWNVENVLDETPECAGPRDAIQRGVQGLASACGRPFLLPVVGGAGLKMEQADGSGDIPRGITPTLTHRPKPTHPTTSEPNREAADEPDPQHSRLP